jgi:hypothetical protein
MATSESDVTLCFSGVRLEQLCQEGGKCIDKGRSHYCVCPEGRTGSHCEHEVDPCTAQPCQHGGTCRGYMGGYVCEVSASQGEGREVSHACLCFCVLVWVLPLPRRWESRDVSCVVGKHSVSLSFIQSQHGCYRIFLFYFIFFFFWLDF